MLFLNTPKNVIRKGQVHRKKRVYRAHNRQPALTEYILKDTLSGLRQFLENESPLKMMKNAFYFTLKALFVLKIFKFLS